MIGTERRNSIIEQIKNSKVPISGTVLAETYQVSRQVIVQDIALLRTAGYHIISTNRGYILNYQLKAERVFKVQHSDSEMEKELWAIVDQGGTVVNVMVNHKVYGHMEASLNISSRKQVQDFMEGIRSGKSSPLKNITSNYHYHKVEADSEETLDAIQKILREYGFLVEN